MFLNNNSLRWMVVLLSLLLLPVISFAAGEHDHSTQQSTAEQKSSSPYKIHFKTHPSPKKIVPDKNKVELFFNVKHDGEP
ncbi:MAG: hypothetical protein ABEJ65_07010, partial [bacterium]